MTRRIGRRQAARRRGGFTLLEVIVATALGSLMLLGAFGVLGFMRLSDKRYSETFRDTTDLSILHAAVRRAMQSMVASPTPQGFNPLSGDPPPANESGSERERRLRETDMRRNLGYTDTVRRPRFLLESQVRGQSAADIPRRLEVVLLDTPVGGPGSTAASIRGAFEVTPEIDGLAMVWTPIKPAGPSVKLAGGIESVRWSALARDQIENRFRRQSGAWRGDLASTHLAEFPRAVSLEIVMRRGTRVEWMFEPAVTTGGEP